MNSHNFLCSVADYYCNSGADLSNLTLVFPNKRAAKFMRKYFKERFKHTGFMPRMVSISYFTQIWAGGSQLASANEQLFTLYKCYCDVLRAHKRPEEEIRDFDTFIFWGKIILHDFDDVDAYMVNADELFKNLRDEKEIKSTYLTEAQQEVVRKLWGFCPELGDGCDRFWMHVGASDAAHPDGKIKADFLSLWEIMGELYNEFTNTLAEKREIPMATSGRQQRLACENICNVRRIEDLDGRRYAFIGFNVLSTARVLTFKHLQGLGAAEFFWDISSPFFKSTDTSASNFAESFNKAAKFILPLSRKFPMPEDYVMPVVDKAPEIEIISTPSNTAQTKTAGLILKEWYSCKEKTPLAHLDTVVVLNDTALLTSMLHSIPPEISTINVTMGLSYKYTPLATFLSGIFRMHLRQTSRKDFYFFEDVNEVLSHPFINVIAPEEANALRNFIKQNRLYNISADELKNKAPQLEFIFAPIDETDVDSSIRFMNTLLDTLSSRLQLFAPEGYEKGYEYKIITSYAEKVKELCDYIKRFDVAMKKSTFLQTLERSLAQETLPFSGDPIEGLQIMGMPDTRALEFENVIVLSMNERIFPRKSLRPTFIPETLRAGYGLPTLDFEESISAYQFYRLISRAKRVKLLYDNRTQAHVSGEMSRYLYQLIYMPCGAEIIRSSVEIEPKMVTNASLTVQKTDEVIKELRRYRSDAPDEEKRYLSASGLKTYLKCPLQFYLKYVRGLNDEDVPEAYMNAAQLGTILHEMARTLFMDYKKKNFDENAPDFKEKQVLIDKGVLETMMDKDLLLRLAKQMVSKVGYKKRYDTNLDGLPGEGRVIAKIMAEYMYNLLKAERDEGEGKPYYFRDAEMGESERYVWELNDDLKLNFKMSIDRLDAFEDGTLRFIDYKTGKDKISSDDIISLFTDEDKFGMLQLLMYRCAYADIFKFTGAIVPKIYKVFEIATKGLPEMKIGEVEIADYPDLSKDFREKLIEVLEQIFEEDNKYPFKPTDDEKNCKYCIFVDMCNRTSAKRLAY